jgi:ABC-type transport system involved in multi-copper enzyme maturation permease subunit
MSAFLADFRLAILLMFRSRLLPVVAVIGALLAATAWLAAQFSPRQPSTVALDVGISFIRLVVPVLGLLQVQELLAREVDRRLILTSLTYPRSRTLFVLARSCAVALVALGLLVFLSAILAGVVTLARTDHGQATPVALGLPYLLNNVLLWLDVVVVLAFGVALATVATTPHLVLLGGVGFMIIGRSASTIVMLLEQEKNLVRGADWYHQGLQWVQWIVPDLAALDVRSVALYGRTELLSPPVGGLLLMAAGYAALLLTLACLRFERRQFN